MASGDLTTPTPKYGGDEIGILSSELDKLRITLNDTLRQEQESRQANQDLITAMSHDLRTPLTILNGYLEVLKFRENAGYAGRVSGSVPAKDKRYQRTDRPDV